MNPLPLKFRTSRACNEPKSFGMDSVSSRLFLADNVLRNAKLHNSELKWDIWLLLKSSVIKFLNTAIDRGSTVMELWSSWRLFNCCAYGMTNSGIVSSSENDRSSAFSPWNSLSDELQLLKPSSDMVPGEAIANLTRLYPLHVTYRNYLLVKTDYGHKATLFNTGAVLLRCCTKRSNKMQPSGD